ncbi:alkanesulfonate monooxygenase SsuD/methylene tetrahydromethanopterin reductase-like flavin-dependent oxidoreductase (luciferase family) [Nocardia transvalensis]|uniref:Alkanesulfonate monooxygenase SsuD/methylene tetrahydromethanopterin reductase-like flavin-dependent oxidoreductase (Luciferase family) n=1 Tax=Nocardia transvalensis TaxID=37333 RepID=A0A7W9P9W1_9NOCA|nr:alkanesulfonate monooxygenase SsuD/methylene tetrahydromethanopterin reductase-like flavin-dependent oxidoreductase (luciferase family) [Nocardia transvalensis]
MSSISCGERMTFHNPEMWTTLAAAAAVTERVRIIANLSVLPAHPVALVAKQAATIDVLSEGRFTLGVGVGGRGDDYRSLAAGFGNRHERLDRAVAELRSLWAGTPPSDGADPVGPPCVQPGGPPVLAGALGPKSLARAAQWADGVVSFSVGGSPQEIAWSADAARRAWADAGRDEPRLVSGCFYVLGVPEPERVLRDFTSEYLAFLGPESASGAAAAMQTYDADALRRTLDAAEAAGLDEFILVPGSADLAVLESTLELIRSR